MCTVKVSILQGSVSGTAVYTETQTATSNANGLVTLQIGGGTVVSGTFSTIDWSSGSYFIKSEIDPTGGTSYLVAGTTQLLSVAYALYANSAGSSTTGEKTYKAVGTTPFYAGQNIGLTDMPEMSITLTPTNNNTNRKCYICDHNTYYWKV